MSSLALPSITITQDNVIHVYTIASSKVWETEKSGGTWLAPINPFGSTFTSPDQVTAAIEYPAALWTEGSTSPYSLKFGVDSGITLYNAYSTSGTVSSSPYQITLSNVNVGTGSNRLLVVGIEANNQGATSVTFGGIALTQAVNHLTHDDTEFWYLANPSGTANIVVTFWGSTQAVVGAYSFSGVDQTGPIAGTAKAHNLSAGSPHISITTRYANDLVLDLPSIYGGSTLGSPTCTQQWDANVPNAITGASSSATVQLPSTVSCGWTASSADFWDDIAVELKAN